jgi:hypothetical protein
VEHGQVDLAGHHFAHAHSVKPGGARDQFLGKGLRPHLWLLHGVHIPR